MRHDPLFHLWAITCPTPQDCRRLQQWLASELDPDSSILTEVRASPDGIESLRQEVHRLGDYFESVELLPSAEQEPTSLRLLFRRRPTAGRFWKDFMVRILQKVRVEAGDATTTLEYRGDEEPVVVAARS